MLVLLPFGMAVNPEIVKLLHVRPDQKQGRGGQVVVFNVVVKTDDDGYLVLASLESREEAEELVRTCAKRINAGLKDEEDSTGGDEDEAEEEDADEDAAEEEEEADEDASEAEDEAAAEDDEPPIKIDFDDDW